MTPLSRLALDKKQSWVTQRPGQDWTESVLQFHIFYPFALCPDGRTCLWHTRKWHLPCARVYVYICVCVSWDNLPSTACFNILGWIMITFSPPSHSLTIYFVLFLGHVVEFALTRGSLSAKLLTKGCMFPIKAICNLGEAALKNQLILNVLQSFTENQHVCKWGEIRFFFFSQTEFW